MIKPTRITIIAEPDVRTSTERKVITAIDPQYSIREIAQRAGLSITVVMWVAQKLANRGIVSIS